MMESRGKAKQLWDLIYHRNLISFIEDNYLSFYSMQLLLRRKSFFFSLVDLL